MGLTIDDLMAAPLFGANRHILEYDELVYAIPRNVTGEDLRANHAAGLPLERERIIRCKDCKFYDELIQILMNLLQNIELYQVILIHYLLNMKAIMISY